MIFMSNRIDSWLVKTFQTISENSIISIYRSLLLMLLDCGNKRKLFYFCFKLLLTSSCCWHPIVWHPWVQNFWVKTILTSLFLPKTKQILTIYLSPIQSTDMLHMFYYYKWKQFFVLFFDQIWKIKEGYARLVWKWRRYK